MHVSILPQYIMGQGAAQDRQDRRGPGRDGVEVTRRCREMLTNIQYRILKAIRPGDAQIELVQPNADDSPVTRFLREKGGGFHHICYEVADLEERMAEMKSRGAMIAKRPKPAVAFQGRRIAWMLTAEKLLIQ